MKTTKRLCEYVLAPCLIFAWFSIVTGQATQSSDNAVHRIRILRITDPIKIDGRLDEPAWSDDRIEIILDTYHDQRNAFRFAVNPLGTRQDALITDEGKDINLSWDGSWISAGRIDARGYVVEIEIPLTTLRFTEGIVFRFPPRRFSVCGFSSIRASWVLTLRFQRPVGFSSCERARCESRISAP